MELSLCNGVLGKLIVAQLVKNFPTVEVSLCVHESPLLDTVPELGESSLHSHIRFH